MERAKIFSASDLDAECAYDAYVRRCETGGTAPGAAFGEEHVAFAEARMDDAIGRMEKKISNLLDRVSLLAMRTVREHGEERVSLRAVSSAEEFFSLAAEHGDISLWIEDGRLVMTGKGGERTVFRALPAGKTGLSATPLGETGVFCGISPEMMG